MLKIVHIAKPIGGVGVYIHLLAKYMDVNKFEHHIICNTTDKIIPLNDSNGNRLKNYHLHLNREISPFTDLKCLLKIIRLLKKINPDIVHCHSAKAGILGRLAGNYLKINTLYTPHAYSYLSTENKFKRFIYMQIEKSFRRSKSKTLACSPSEYQRTISDLSFSNQKVLLWNNSIEKITELPKSKLQKSFPEHYICAVGRPSYQKNTELLINAIYQAKKSIQNIHLVILGVGLYSPLLEKTKEKIDKLQLSENVSLVPWLNRKESLSILKNSLFLISSSRYEGLPYAVIEALALSKPCILTDVDGNKDLVENTKNGFLVQENTNELVTKIIKLYSDNFLLETQSKASYQKYLESYEIEKNIKKLAEIYLNLN